MNILEFKQYYYPEIAAGIALDSNTAEDLAERGHVVKLFVPYPSRGISKEIAKKTPKHEILKNGHLIIHRYPMFNEGKNIVQRLLRYICCAIMQLWFGIKEKNIDLIFAGSTPPFQGLIVFIIKSIKKIPFVFNCQDIFPDSMETAGITKKNSIIWKIGNIISNFIYKISDRIIVISESMYDNLISKGVEKEKIQIIYNWIDESVVLPVDYNMNFLIHELNIPKFDFTIVYAGNLGYTQSIDTILETARELKSDKRIGFIIFGNGVLEDKVKIIIQENKLDNVLLYSLQPYNRVSEVYSIGDACIVSCSRGTGQNAMPSKTWSIMACRRPILASFDEESLLQKIIQENNCGLFSQAENSELLKNNILFLCNNKELCREMGKNAFDFAQKKLTRKSNTNKICELIEDTYKKYNE